MLVLVVIRLLTEQSYCDKDADYDDYSRDDDARA